MTVTNHNLDCPLCGNTDPKLELKGPDSRRYICCDTCKLVFVTKPYHLNAKQEKLRYTQHENGPDNTGYVRFLNQAILPAIPFVKPKSKALDFGCGPMPTLCGLLKEHGIDCDNYDPYFFPDKSFSTAYDMVFATEVIEHFNNPIRSFEEMCALFQPKGILVLMTNIWSKSVDFQNWSYARDKTHVAFYHADTMAYIAARFKLEIVFTDNRRVVVMRTHDFD